MFCHVNGLICTKESLKNDLPFLTMAAEKVLILITVTFDTEQLKSENHWVCSLKCGYLIINFLLDWKAIPRLNLYNIWLIGLFANLGGNFCVPRYMQWIMMANISSITNKRHMGHVAYLSKNSNNKFSFIESFTKYLDNMVEKILFKTFSIFSPDINILNIESHLHSHTCITYWTMQFVRIDLKQLFIYIYINLH